MTVDVSLGSGRTNAQDPHLTSTVTTPTPRAVPVPDPKTKRPRIVLPGDPPSPVNPPPGCPFHPRCRHPGKDATCVSVRPELEERAPVLRVACHRG